MPLKHPRLFGVTYKRFSTLPNNKRSRGNAILRRIEIYRNERDLFGRREREIKNCLWKKTDIFFSMLRVRGRWCSLRKASEKERETKKV